MKELFNELSLVELVLMCVLSAAVMIQLFYSFYFYFRLVLFKRKNNPTDHPPVSVVICARNESENLMNHIPIIMEQDYPSFEVVVVNDSSWDDSEDILKALQVKYDNLKVLKLNEDVHRMTGKKFALTMGIKAAKYEQLLLTDADCEPLTNTWISDMMAMRQENRTIVLGVSLLKKGKGFWKNLFRFESAHTAINYSSMALGGTPYMGVGRNLSYDKESFFSVGGFRRHMHVTGGDDDLFINEVCSKSNTCVMPELESQTVSDSPEGIKKWWHQKRRHLSTSGMYKSKHKLLLALEPISWWAMWGCSITLLVLPTPVLLVITPVVLRYLIVYGTFIAIGRKWKALDAVWAFPLWEIFLNLTKPAILLSNMISKPKQWM